MCDDYCDCHRRCGKCGKLKTPTYPNPFTYRPPNYPWGYPISYPTIWSTGTAAGTASGAVSGNIQAAQNSLNQNPPNTITFNTVGSAGFVGVTADNNLLLYNDTLLAT